MARVYIVNMGGHNHHLAEPYGKLVPITEGYVSQGSLDRVLHEVISKLSNSTPSDWLLLSGLIFLNAVTAAIWLERHKSLKLLVWDKKNRRYREFHTDLSHLHHLWEYADGQDSGSSLSG